MISSIRVEKLFGLYTYTLPQTGQLPNAAKKLLRDFAPCAEASCVEEPGAIEFYVSDSPEAFMAVGEPLLGRNMERVFLEHVWQRELETTV
ncbi:MAG: hypothetical protein KKB51_03415 [Candidatus Riflebacteria bacterium]|nr:hypothetical protein [Candidatus Riflebacteria bacterium]